MSKKVAVLVPNPVNGYGLFTYLEEFFESGVEYKTFALDKTNVVKTNSGYELKLDGVIGDLKGNEDTYDAVVFACGDAIMKLGDWLPTQEWQDGLEVLKTFNTLNKKIAGHCAGAMIFEMAGISEGKKVAVHPLGKANVKKGIAVDNRTMIDQNLYTACCESEINGFLPLFIKML